MLAFSLEVLATFVSLVAMVELAVLVFTRLPILSTVLFLLLVMSFERVVDLPLDLLRLLSVSVVANAEGVVLGLRVGE